MTNVLQQIINTNLGNNQTQKDWITHITSTNRSSGWLYFRNNQIWNRAGITSKENRTYCLRYLGLKRVGFPCNLQIPVWWRFLFEQSVQSNIAAPLPLWPPSWIGQPTRLWEQLCPCLVPSRLDYQRLFGKEPALLPEKTLGEERPNTRGRRKSSLLSQTPLFYLEGNGRESLALRALGVRLLRFHLLVLSTPPAGYIMIKVLLHFSDWGRRKEAVLDWNPQMGSWTVHHQMTAPPKTNLNHARTVYHVFFNTQMYSRELSKVQLLLNLSNSYIFTIVLTYRILVFDYDTGFLSLFLILLVDNNFNSNYWIFTLFPGEKESLYFASDLNYKFVTSFVRWTIMTTQVLAGWDGIMDRISSFRCLINSNISQHLTGYLKLSLALNRVIVTSLMAAISFSLLWNVLIINKTKNRWHLLLVVRVFVSCYSHSTYG